MYYGEFRLLLSMTFAYLITVPTENSLFVITFYIAKTTKIPVNPGYLALLELENNVSITEKGHSPRLHFCKTFIYPSIQPQTTHNPPQDNKPSWPPQTKLKNPSRNLFPNLLHQFNPQTYSINLIQQLIPSEV